MLIIRLDMSVADTEVREGICVWCMVYDFVDRGGCQNGIQSLAKNK